MQHEQKLILHYERINKEGRGFKIVIAGASPSYGVHINTTGKSMRASFIGFRSDGNLEVSSRLHCAITDFTVQTPGGLTGITIIEGEGDCSYAD